MAARADRGPVSDGTALPLGYQGAAPALCCPALAGTHRVDVAVIGAGFTGLSTALHLVQAGVSVTVLDGREVGWGGSGRAFGQVVPYFKPSDAQVQADWGPDWGERMVRGAGAGPDLVFDLIARHGIACEHARGGLIFAAHTPRAEPGLESRARFWEHRGVAVSMLHGDTLAAETGTRFYRTGLLDPRGGTLNPLAYARGLARAVLAAGGVIYENSPALSLARNGPVWQVRSSAGELLASQVVLATDAYTDGLWPGLRRSIVPLRAYQFVSRPLSDNLRRTVLPGGQALSDTRRLYSAIRLRPDGRIHASAYGPALRSDAAANPALATQRVQALFPHLPPPAWDSTVAGWVGMTADHYPHLHRLAPGLLAAIGLNGRGIALGTLMGREASLRVLNRPEGEWMMPDTPLRPIRAKPVLAPILSGLLTYYRALDGMDLQRLR
jgi:glycine/D-amino acid oxidase-like deaminating enzyme